MKIIVVGSFSPVCLNHFFYNIFKEISYYLGGTMIREDIKIGVYGLHQYYLHGYMWLPDDGMVNRVIHILHGMTEHIGRYEQFAKDLTQFGIAVVGFDLRGHGRNSGPADCASFLSGQKSDSDYGWERSVDEIKQQIDYVKKRIPHADYYLMGFSLGSFMLRDYIRTHRLKKINGVIVVGSGYQPPIVTKIMQLVALNQIHKANVAGTTDLIRQLSFGTYNKPFAGVENATGMEWLCSDEQSLAEYQSDSLVRKDIAADLFYELLGAMSRTNKKRAFFLKKLDLSNVPVLIISGAEDPVGNNGQDVEKISKIFKSYNAQSITPIIVPEARHDVFHEYKNGRYNEMMHALIEWLGIS